MKIEDLKRDLLEGIVELTFIKSNGDLRTIYATMSPEYVPEPKAPKNPNMSRPTPEGNVLFWDMDTLGFKSCKFENVTGWKGE